MVTIKEHTQRYGEVMQELIVSYDLTDQRFADSVGIARALVSHIRNEKQNASIDLIVETAKVYEEVNTDYILTGRGNMWMDEVISEEDITYPRKEDQQLILKLQEELKEAYAELKETYAEIGRLNMELKAAKEHTPKKKIG